MNDKLINIKPPWRSPEVKPEIRKGLYQSGEVIVTTRIDLGGTKSPGFATHVASWLCHSYEKLWLNCFGKPFENKRITVIAWQPMPEPCGEEAEPEEKPASCEQCEKLKAELKRAYQNWRSWTEEKP